MLGVIESREGIFGSSISEFCVAVDVWGERGADARALEGEVLMWGVSTPHRGRGQCERGVYFSRFERRKALRCSCCGGAIAAMKPRVE